MFEYRAKITSIYDGDTCRADIDLGFGLWIKDQPIRIYGIDCPEINTDEGKAARDYADHILFCGRVVVMTTLKDKKEKYGRYLGKITLADGGDYGSRMVEAGHATPYFGGTKTP